MISQLNSIKDYDFVGCDLDLSAIKYASNKFNKIRNMKFINKNLLDINLNKKFDIIIFRGTLQYLAWDLIPTFNYLKRLVKKRKDYYIFTESSGYFYLMSLKINGKCLIKMNIKQYL